MLPTARSNGFDLAHPKGTPLDSAGLGWDVDQQRHGAHGARACLRGTQSLYGLDTAVDTGDLLLKLFLLVHHDFELRGDPLLLVQLTLRFGLCHLGADNVPADDRCEQGCDND